MRYHPDKNENPRALEGFILINEAYEYLSDPSRRTKSTPLTSRERDDERRKAMYEEWVRSGRAEARARAEAYSQQSFSSFVDSKVFQAAMDVDRIYKYLFIGMGVLMVLFPIFGSNYLTEEEKKDFNYYGLIFPVIIGIAFIYGIWYFLFKLEAEKDD